MNNNGMLTEEDEETVFTTSEICGYGVSIIGVVDNHGQYYVTFRLGDSCDWNGEFNKDIKSFSSYYIMSCLSCIFI